jgi:type III pantothenate kinase
MSRKPPTDYLWACDVGNTRVGLALVLAGRLTSVVRVPVGGLDGLVDCFRASGESPAAVPVIVSSVNPAAAEKLRALVTAFTTGPFLLAGRDFPIPIETAVRQPDRVGVDRLLGALAARPPEKNGRAVIVVGVGTAITVDAVAAAGRFLGGAITASPVLAAWALHERTAALPKIDLSGGWHGPAQTGHEDEPAGAPNSIGDDTESALRAGLVLGAAGAIERLVADQRRLLAVPARVVATGGGLPVLRSALSCLDEVRPDLVLEGLVLAYGGRT